MRAELEAFPLVAPAIPMQLGGDPTPGIAVLWDSYNDGRRLAKRVIRHQGSDIGAVPGTLVVAAIAGTVEAARWSGLGGWAVTVRSIGVATHSTYVALYAHFLTPPFVKAGDRVEVGSLLGVSGQTGGVENAQLGARFTAFPHLHFSVTVNSSFWDATPQLLARLRAGRTVADVEHGYEIPLVQTDRQIALTTSARAHIDSQIQGGMIPPWYVKRTVRQGTTS